jgi:hypothetical protein
MEVPYKEIKSLKNIGLQQKDVVSGFGEQQQAFLDINKSHLIFISYKK